MDAPGVDRIGSGDFDTYPVDHEITGATVDERTVRVNWDDGHVSRFHFVWLRDNCPDCIHPETREPMFDITLLQEDLSPRSVDVTPEGGLQVVWSDNEHSSHYHPGWLRHHCYTNGANGQNSEPVLWDSTASIELHRFSWADIVVDEEVETSWLQSIATNGYALAYDVPVTPDSVAEVAGRIGVIRDTNFGRFWDVTTRPDPNSAAYTGIKLPPHTDLPTREYQPGLQVLHCLTNTVDGGASVLVDGFRVADEIRERHPNIFQLLTTVPWDFGNRSRTSDYRWRAPIIGLNVDGSFDEVRAGRFLRMPLRAQFDLVEPLYDAYRLFESLSCDPRFQTTFRLEPSECLIFDNRRVLHGREAFSSETGERHLQGCYVERDELHSAIRILARSRKVQRTRQPDSK